MADERLKGLEDRLGYRFKEAAYLSQALTHKSYANENRSVAIGHNERLEFLGDTVLDFIVSDILMALCPESQEGDLSKLRSVIVSEPSLASVARSLEFGDFLYLGKGEEHTGGRDKNSLLANALEAVIAAMYLDGGLDASYRFVRENFEPDIKSMLTNGLVYDFKTDLQEKCQSRFGTLPRYRVVNESGPDHQKVFEVEIEADGKTLGRGSGSSKKEAEQMAAREALEMLRGE
ncbi:MAG: ribonuclease III [Nitrospirae bacterium]|nr:ribonuclease III [Nitrospirota bacterium]